MKLKFCAKHFRFIVKPIRLVPKIWKEYYALAGKPKLSEKETFHLKQIRLNMRKLQYEVTGEHLPSGHKQTWTIKKDKVDKKDLIKKLLADITKKRSDSKRINKISKSFEGANFHMVGGVFEKTGLINEIAKNTKIHDPYIDKKPRRKDKNYIGIEIEFNALSSSTQDQRRLVGEALRKKGLSRYVDVTTDGSCGYEVRVLLSEDDFEKQLTGILNTIKELGFPCDSRCGTHVHFDMRNRDVKTVYYNMFKTQKFLRKFLTRERKTNRFCRMNKASTFDTQLNLGDRYHAINVEAYRRHKTLEVRMHQGTLEATQLIPWIKFLLKICNYKSQMETDVNTLRQAKKQFDIEPELAKTLESKMITIFSKKILGA